MDYQKTVINIPVYDPESGSKLEWEDDFIIKVKKEDESVIISANENGLKSLAKHFLTLANFCCTNSYSFSFR